MVKIVTVVPLIYCYDKVVMHTNKFREGNR